LIEIEYEDQSTVSYTYDLNSNRTQMDDDAPNTGDYVAYTYDTWNRLLTETRHISQDSFPVTYQYDVASRITQMIYPDSMQILYTYDDLNRITEIKRYIDGQNDEILFDNPQYDVESLLTQFDYGNDIQATYTYDSRDRPLTIDVKDGATPLLDLDYTYDDNSNITQLINGWGDTSSTWHSETESYSYDGLDRLTSASCTSWSHTYTYDKAGNRIGKDSITYTLNSINEVTALSDGTSFTYDDNGNRIQKTKGDDTWDYTYDYATRLTQVAENQSTIGEYVYDGDGKRLQKTENSITTTYIYSGINPVYEENSTGSACYVYGPIGLIAKRTTISQESNTYYYHKDHLGSTRSVTDSSKNIISASTYHPFGETEVEEGFENYLYNGKGKDSTGLYYYGARYYDPETGRFITRDLIAGRKSNSQTLNLYTYCLNNPVNLIDPAGLDSICFGDGESRRCFDFTDNGGWMAYDGNGNLITTSTEISDLVQSGDGEKIQEAVVLMLQVLRYDVEENQIETTEVYDPHFKKYIPAVTMVVNGIDVMIKITEIEHGGFEMIGTSILNDDGSVTVTLKIGTNVHPSTFYHILGHEMIHVEQYTSGIFNAWSKAYGEARACALAEMIALLWNYNRLHYFPIAYGKSDLNQKFSIAWTCWHTGNCPKKWSG
jgi:RHS repeat-associated protein